MKKKITKTKILGVGLALVLIASLFSFAAPVSAALPPINTWYPYAFPVAGATGGWFYSPDILRVGEITEATDGTLYVHVQQCVPDATFTVTSGEMTISEYEYEAAETDSGQIHSAVDVR